MSNGPSFGITSFHIKGFRGIKNALVEGIPADTKWIFLTGKNGGGKTSVLQALFVGLRGKQDVNGVLGEDNFELGISVHYKGKRVTITETNSQDNGEDGEYNDHSSRRISPMDFNLKFRPSVVAYGAIRTRTSASIGDDDSSKSKSLFDEENVSRLLNIEAALRNWASRSTSEEVKKQDINLAKSLESKVLKSKELLLKLMPNLHEIEIDLIKDIVLYYEKDDEGQMLKEAKTFKQLASGNRSIIAMIGDMIQWLFTMQKEVSDPSDLEGIVLIDELDVHLHPTWQKALPGLLSEIFPKIQFIASTHSPIPLLGAPKESVVLKVHQSSEEGITVEKLDIDLTRLLPNSLLTSPIFDFDEIIPIANTSLSDLHTEDSFQEAMANEEIKNRLKKIAQSLK